MYWVIDPFTEVHCGINHTGSSCEDDNPETGDKSVMIHNVDILHPHMCPVWVENCQH